MARLTTKQRNKLPNSAFAGPDRSYPVQDKSHAANAKARASQQYNKGNISKSTEEAIFRKANAKMKGPMKHGHEMGDSAMYDRHLGNPAHGDHHPGHVGGAGEVDGHKGHKGHTGDGKMVHMSVPNLGAQNKKHIGKHGGKLGVHPYGGTASGNHSFHLIQHKNHADKMREG